MNTEIPPGLADGIDPSAITIPPVKVEDLEEAARAVKGDGQDVSDIGNDIKSAWGGLQGIYSAPEDETLFSAIDPVATKGDEVGDAARTAGDALLDFAADVRPILERWRALKHDAQDMQDHIDADDDWRSDEDKVEEFNQLNNDLIKVQNDFMAAERECANKITALFGGTTFVATDPGSEPDPGEGEQAYGYTEAHQDVATPWAVPQEHDAPWYADVGAAVVDLTWGSVKDTLALAGLHDGQGDWTLDPATMWGNATQTWSDTFAGAGMLAGYGPDGFSWSTAGTAWTEVAHSMVPWNEWGDRPGYVITQSVVNIGSIVAGVALTASGVGAVAGVPLLAWRGTRVMRTLGRLGDLGPGSGHGGDSGDGGSASGSAASGGRPDFDLKLDGAGPSNGIPTAREIQDQLTDWEDMASELGWEETMRRAGDLAETVEQREPALVGAPNDTPGVQASAEGPNDPPSTKPKPAPPTTESPSSGSPSERPSSPSPSPAGGDGPPGGGPPGGPPGGGDRPQVPEGDDEGDGGDEDQSPTEPGESPTDEPSASHEGSEDPAATSQDDSPSGEPDEREDPPSGSQSDPPENGAADAPRGEQPGRPMLDSQEPGVRQVLQDAGLNGQQIDEIVTMLKDDSGAVGTQVGRQVADILLEGRVAGVKNFAEFATDFSNPGMVHNSGAELRFVDHLIDKGYPVDRLEFADKKSQEETADPAGNADVDTFIRSSDGSDDYAYQIKRLEVRGDEIKGSQLVNNSGKIGKQLRAVSDEAHPVGILEANAPLEELTEKQYNNILKNARRFGITYRIYHPDGQLTIPPGNQVFPNLENG
ncbi:hypothetical protein [Streptomonospora arabica]|uniref:Tox-REase-7 domain-containing protein n=1 Tax=Streptomonospora arabica TaxID=412417 RepID=A0ABV9SQL3_9ACTN